MKSGFLLCLAIGGAEGFRPVALAVHARPASAGDSGRPALQHFDLLHHRRPAVGTLEVAASSGDSGGEVTRPSEPYTLKDLEQYCERNGCRLEEAGILGTFIKVSCRRLTDDRELGYFEGIFRGNVLQLDSVRTAKDGGPLLTGNGIFQLSGVLTAYAMRIAYDKGCKRAELLAIRDSEKMERKLVCFYQMAGFNKMRTIEDTVASLPDRLVWGGVGTLMQIDVDRFLSIWTPIVTKAMAQVEK